MSGETFRKTFGFVRGNILVLTVSGSIEMFCRSMVFPYTPLYIMSLGGNPAEIGLVYALGPIGGLLMFPIAGYLADHVNRPRLIAFTGYFSSAALMVNAFAPTWQWVAGARMLQGFAVFHFPATSAIVADSLPPENRGRGIATMAALSGILALFAPYAAGQMLDTFGVDPGMRYLYAAMSLAYAAAATINLTFIKETRVPVDEPIRLLNLASTLRSVYASIPEMLRGFGSSLKALSVMLILCFVANGVASPFWVVRAKSHLGLTSADWGLILLLEMGLRNLTSIPAGFMVDRYGRTRFILGALLVTAIAAPLFVFAETFVDVLMIRCAVAISAAFFGPASAALLADTVPSAVRGRVMSAIGRGSVNLGAATGGLGGAGHRLPDYDSVDAVVSGRRLVVRVESGVALVLRDGSNRGCVSGSRTLCAGSERSGEVRAEAVKEGAMNEAEAMKAEAAIANCFEFLSPL